MKFSIAHIVSTYPPYGGGMGNVAFYMVDELASRGHLVDVITPDYDKVPATKQQEIKQQKEVALGKQIVRLDPKVSYGNAAILTNIDKKLDQFDIVHLHYPFYGSSNIVRRWKKRNPSKLLVITYHMDSIAFGWKGIIFDMYAKYYTPKILKSADCITVSSIDYVLNSKVNELYQKNKQQWIELPFGVDTNRFCVASSLDKDQIKQRIYNKHGLNNQIPTVLFVGGMDYAHYFKGVDILLDAIAMLKSMGVFIQVLCIGSGNLLPQYKIKSQATRIDDLVKFTGFIPDQELSEYYQSVNATVLPSINKGEAFGMVLLESMACGTPIIASDLPGVRVLAHKGGIAVMPGSVLDLADALQSLITKKDFWDKKSSLVRKIVEEEYTWKHVGDALEKMYNNKLKDHNIIYTASIIHGNKLARTIGYPTANVDISIEELVHEPGVYASVVQHNNKQYLGAFVIMPNPHKVEVHLLDYDGSDIYGDTVFITVVEKISEIEDISDTDALRKKIKNDIILVKNCIANR